MINMINAIAQSRICLKRMLSVAIVVGIAGLSQTPRMANAVAMQLKADAASRAGLVHSVGKRDVNLVETRGLVAPAFLKVGPASVDGADAITLTATVSPTTAFASGADPVTVTASITGFVGSGAGTVISFTTDLGALSSPTATTDVTGTAQVQLTSVLTGVATITATADVTATSSVTATFISAPPPQIAKYAQPLAGTGIARGSVVTYTVVVTAPPGNFANLVITDAIPANTSYIAGSASGTGFVGGSDPITMTQAFVAAGSAATLAFRVTITTGLTATSEITNVASVSAVATPPTTTNSVTHTVRVPSQVTVTVSPDTQPAGGPSSTVTATVTDAGGNPVFGEPVTGLISPAARGTLTPFGSTNASGQAFATWTPGTASGSGAISARAGGVSGTAAITVTPGAVFTVSVIASPDLIFANGVSTTTVTATVVDQFGNLVPGAPVTFTTSAGMIAPPLGATDANGVATATLTSSTTIVAATVQATSGGKTGSAVVRFGPSPGQFSGSLTTSPVITTGDLLTYTFVLTNNGAFTQTNVGMLAEIPDGTTFVSVSGGVFGGGLGFIQRVRPSATNINAASWTGALAPGESHTIIYTVQVTKLFGTLTASAQGVVDAVEIFNSGPVTTTVLPKVRLVLPIMIRS